MLALLLCFTSLLESQATGHFSLVLSTNPRCGDLTTIVTDTHRFHIFSPSMRLRRQRKQWKVTVIAINCLKVTFTPRHKPHCSNKTNTHTFTRCSQRHSWSWWIKTSAESPCYHEKMRSKSTSRPWCSAGCTFISLRENKMKSRKAGMENNHTSNKTISMARALRLSWLLKWVGPSALHVTLIFLPGRRPRHKALWASGVSEHVSWTPAPG